MRITEKILLVFIPAFLLSVVSTTLVSKHAVRRVLIQNVARSGNAITLNLGQSPELVDSFRRGDERGLLAPLQRMHERQDVLYAMVLDRGGAVLAHTNVVEKGKIYSDPHTLRAVASEVPEQAEIEEDGDIIDVSFPVWEVESTDDGEEFLLSGKKEIRARTRLGTIRIGLSLEDAIETAERIADRVFWIATVVNVLAMGVGLFYVRKILGPVRSMAEATQRIGRGELGDTVPVLSQDEMGELPRASIA